MERTKARGQDRVDIGSWLMGRLGLPQLTSTPARSLKAPPSALDEKLTARLRRIVGDDHVSDAPEARLAVAEGRLPDLGRWLGAPPPLPDLVVHPGSPVEVAEILALAYEANIGLSLFGTASGAPGLRAQRPGRGQSGLIALSTARLDALKSLDPEGGLAVVEAGIGFAALAASLSGLRLKGATGRLSGALLRGTV
ncbi:MAG: FAD-binding oxidoreductase, partial [Alphaproteobacteria bacterium]|nr:FAD-binding oxidoreductase [Alphaproteobacteria bacterium]